MAGGQLSIEPKGAKGDAGGSGATGSGAQGLWTPPDNGLVAMNSDPANLTQNLVVSAGIVYLMKVKTHVEAAIASVALAPRSPSGAGLANTFVGVYSVSGSTATLIAQSADVSTQMQTTSEQKVVLSAPTAVQPAGTELWVAVLVGSGTTLPTLLGISGRANMFRTGAGRRILTSGTGQTALPSTVNLATAGDGNHIWAGLST
jgi:hypothetical protein